MAKGDDSRARNRVDYETGRTQNHLDNLRNDTLVPQNQAFWNNYTSSVDQSKADYGSLMAGYKNFADTGGFTPEGLAAIRSRAVSPVRAVYSNANREVDRQRTLQGGYSPGFGTLKARIAREMSQAGSDATTNAEAAIADMVSRNKLAGIAGGANLYGTTPGMTSMFGNQALASTQQRLAGESLQGDNASRAIQGQIAAAQMPGKWEHTIGRINDVFNMGKNIAGIATPFMGGSAAGGLLPTSGTMPAYTGPLPSITPNRPY